jgi:hypothetical protein
MSSRLRALTEFTEAEGRDDTHHAFNRANAYMYHNPTIGSVACRRAARPISPLGPGRTATPGRLEGPTGGARAGLRTSPHARVTLVRVKKLRVLNHRGAWHG